MSRSWNPNAPCTYAMVVGNTTPVCPQLATYIILAPPLAFEYTPTRIYTAEENPRSAVVQARPAPQYCRHHAYLLCGRDPATPEGLLPPQGRPLSWGSDDAALL